MKLQQDKLTALSHAVTHLGKGYVQISGQRYEQNVMLSKDQIQPAWGPDGLAGLRVEDVAQLLTWHPEIVLIGTGDRLHFPSPSVLRPLIEAGIGYEIQDTANACKTFNVLLSEGRRVVAGLIIESQRPESPPESL